MNSNIYQITEQILLKEKEFCSQDNKLLKNTMKAICILDGDQNVDKDKIYGIIALPGKNHFKGETGKSPEKLLFDYAEEGISFSDVKLEVSLKGKD